MIINALIITLLFATFVQQLFFTYFKRDIDYADIYNFFTHIDETLESFFTLLSMFTIPIMLFFLAIFLLFFIKKLYQKLLIMLILIFLNYNFIVTLLHISSSSKEYLKDIEIPLQIKRKTNTNIILIIGESMKYNSYINSKLKEQNFFYKKIYSGATNTDISIPLLINTKTNQLDLTFKNETNLFLLAKKNHYKTSFISIQTDKSLKYIKPFLYPSMIDSYKTYTKQEREPKYDFNLLYDLKKINLEEKNFIILHQIGQHSPYIYHPDQKPSYIKSIDYSFKLYEEIYNYLNSSKKPFIMLYTSDHGEFTKEDKKFGHNCFDKTIYEVPFFITSNTSLPPQYKDIKSHYHISQFLTYLLGYNSKLTLSCQKHIVNGTMITREDGFIKLN